jgi:hypothetical protein
MIYVEWPGDDLAGIEHDGIHRVLTEIDTEGFVLREVDLDPARRVAYHAPARGGPLGYGLFDVVKVDVAGVEFRSLMDPREFNRTWDRASRADVSD